MGGTTDVPRCPARGRFMARLLAWDVGLGALEALLTVWPFRAELCELGGCPQLALALPLAAALHLAASLRLLQVLQPVVRALASKATGAPVPTATADRAEAALRDAPVEAGWLRLGILFGLAVLLTAGATDGHRRGWMPAALLALGLVQGCGLAALRTLTLERLFDGLRPMLLPNLDPMRVYAAVYRGRLARLGLVLLGAAECVTFLMFQLLVGDHAQMGGALRLLGVAAVVPGVAFWWRSLMRRTAPMSAYFEATLRQGTRGPLRDEPRAVTAFRAAQALPYRLALYQLLVVALAHVLAIAIGRRVGAFDERGAARLLLADGLAVLVAAAYQVVLLRDILRPFLRHLASRHHLPLEDIRAGVGLAIKLVTFAVGTGVASAALVALTFVAPGSAAAVALAAGGVLVLLPAVGLFVRQTVAPISALASRSGEMARGELARPVPPAGEADEIGRLTAAFDEMRRSLRDKLRSTESINVDLEREVRRRTEALEQRNAELRSALEKLRKAQDDLVRSEKLASMGRLVAGIAHEINNPVNAVINSLTPLQDAVKAMAGSDSTQQMVSLTEEATEMLGVIQRGAARAKAIVGALHNYSRGDETTFREVSLARSFDDCLDLLRHRLRDVKIDRHVDPDAKVVGLPGQIDQVLMNLVTNAAQALGAAGGTISLNADRRDDGVEISVADDGPGIAPELLPRIFDPFFTTKDVGEGSGLGLSIVHGIVERHGGRIDVDSTLGRGTTFRVWLPRNGPAGSPAHAAAAARG